MCAQFMVAVSTSEISKYLAAPWLGGTDKSFSLIAPYQMAPILHLQDEKRILEPMSFSLVPRWSKEPKVKFATHNARLESVNEKPSFKEAFQKRPCLVPLTGFIEPIYEGELAGNMVEFFAESSPLLMAAGIFEEWQNPQTKELLTSFSILTQEPLPFVGKMGHDRSPLFLELSLANTWMNPNSFKNSTEKKEWLLENSYEPNLATRTHRPLKAGWEKRK